MTEVPKIVCDRLRAARPRQTSPEQAHPDADLLTAFAEQSLSAREREGMLNHLAACRDCREVISLALPSADFETSSVIADTPPGRARVIAPEPSGSWLTFGNFTSSTSKWLSRVSPGVKGHSLRWAALAAGVAVAASVLVLHPGKSTRVPLPYAKQQAANTVPPSLTSQVAATSVPPSPLHQSTIPTEAGRTRKKSDIQLSGTLKAGRSMSPSPLDASVPREANEIAATAAPALPAPSSTPTLLARNDSPAIEKAKPARPGSDLQTIGSSEQKATEEDRHETADSLDLSTLASKKVMSTGKPASPGNQGLEHNVNWTIAGGVLQRSIDGGHSWQDALRANQPLLCFASHHEDIWTGGPRGTLYHSPDSGVTWVQIQPSIQALQLGGNITHIDLRGTEVIVFSSDHERWSSGDGGTTWEKK